LLAGALGLAGPARPLFVAAARGRASAEEVLAALREAAAAEGPAPGPYLGLVPFEERDARLSYGRGELADRLVRRLAERLHGAGMLLVTGESGSGKSSLLRAGLMPRLAAGALGPGSQWWPRRVIRPTASPLRELAMALAEMAGADPVSVYRSRQAAPGEAPMLAGQAVRVAAGRGAGPGPGGPAGAAAGAPPRLVLAATAPFGCGTWPPGRPPPSQPKPGQAGACSAWRSARTASSWPPPTATAMRGCGIWPPGRPSALPSQPVPARGERVRRGLQPRRQAPGHRRHRRHPRAVANAAFLLTRTQHSVPMSDHQQRQNGCITPRVNHSPKSADDTCRDGHDLAVPRIRCWPLGRWLVISHRWRGRWFWWCGFRQSGRRVPAWRGRNTIGPWTLST
jgi:hypothetical protein